MLRRQPTPRPRMTPGLNPAAETDEDNHLRDDVVAMFRESFDEDGLDFLKRGPRTARERLAYAQRVRPDAHLTVPPAPADVQRRFADYGTMDRIRNFVGPDRIVYLRGDDSTDFGAAATRRGFEAAVGGFSPVSLEDALAELSNVSTAEADQPNGVDGMGYLADHQPVPPDARLIDPAEQAIDQIEQRYRDYAEYGHRHGHDVAASTMERFLSGSGAAMRLDPAWLRSFPSVRDAEDVVLRYFEEWMAGGQKTSTPSEDIHQDLVNLADGATLQGGSTWTRKFTPGFLLEQEARATLGQSNLTGTGSFTFRREGNVIHVDGVVRLTLEDNYDWEPGITGLVPMPEESFPWVEENRHDDAIKLQDHRGAKPFRLHSQWSKNFRGMMLLWRGGTSLRTMHWQDRQR